MATLAIQPSICAERQRLSAALLQATRELVEMLNSEIAHVVDRGEGLMRSDLALKRARQKRDEAKQSLFEHVREHCC